MWSGELWLNDCRGNLLESLLLLLLGEGALVAEEVAGVLPELVHSLYQTPQILLHRISTECVRVFVFDY